MKMVAQIRWKPMVLILLLLVTSCIWAGRIQLARAEPGPGNSPGQRLDSMPHVAFLSDRDRAGYAEIYIMQQDGSGQTRLTTDLGLVGFMPGKISGLEGRFAWDPVQRRYFYSTRAGEFYSVAEDGTDRTLVAHDVHLFDLSPDGQWVAFSRPSGAPTYGEIATMRIDGTNVTFITSAATRTSLGLPVATPFFGPTWSPAGYQIAFYGRNSLFAVNRDGSGPALLTQRNDISGALKLDWSPSGQKIAFPVVVGALMRYDLRVFDVASGVDAALIQDGFSPGWWPDDSRLLFTRADEQVWIANANGTGPLRLTVTGHNCCPVAVYTTTPPIERRVYLPGLVLSR